MSTTVKGVYRNGRIVLLEASGLSPGGALRGATDRGLRLSEDRRV